MPPPVPLSANPATFEAARAGALSQFHPIFAPLPQFQCSTLWTEKLLFSDGFSIGAPHTSTGANVLTIPIAKGPEGVQTPGAFAPLKLRCPRPRLEVPAKR